MFRVGRERIYILSKCIELDIFKAYEEKNTPSEIVFNNRIIRHSVTMYRRAVSAGVNDIYPVSSHQGNKQLLSMTAFVPK